MCLTYVSGLDASSNGAFFNQIHNNTDSTNTQKNASKRGEGEYRKRRQGRAAYLTYVSGLDAFSNGASFNQIHNNTDSTNTQKTRQNGGKASIEKDVKGALRV